jgi:hypothetical protein
MNRKRLALVMFLISAVMGILGAGLFNYDSLGINVPIYMLIVTGVILLAARLTDEPTNRRNLWVIVPMLFFAVMVAFRASYLLLGLNLMAMLALGALFIRYLKSEQALDTAPLLDTIFTPLDVGLYAIYAPLVEVAHSFNFIRERNWKDVGKLGAVLRGLLFAVPILVVFGVLLGSADQVFANAFDGLFDWLFSANLFTLTDSVLIAGFTGWLMLTALSYALANIRPVPQAQATVEETDAGVKKQRPGFRIGMIEATMVLGSVTLLFAFFVVIQFAYLFGGQANIADGLSYSQYARRGFFELVAVAVLVLGMILYFDHITLRRDNRQGLLFRMLSIVIVGLTMVMLVSAWRRMELYELAYGFTYLRVLTHVFMFWLAVALVFAILHVMRLRTNIFALGLLLSCIGYVGTLNLMNVDNYIAQRNIQAYLDGDSVGHFDICYLRGLSVDAYEPMANFYYQLPETNRNQLHSHVGWWLHQRDTESHEHTNLLATPLAYWAVQSRVGISARISTSDLDPDIQYACYGRYLF